MFSIQNDNLSIKGEYMRNTVSQSRELSCVVYEYIESIGGFLGGSGIKNLPASAGDLFDPWVRKIPWGRKWQPIPVFLPGKSRGQRSYSQQGHKESDMTEQA